ncbi:hypothetical protein FKM82_026224 [Ascaphus truei]
MSIQLRHAVNAKRGAIRSAPGGMSRRWVRGPGYRRQPDPSIPPLNDGIPTDGFRSDSWLPISCNNSCDFKKKKE